MSAPRSWLYRTVHNLALNRHRDEKRIVPLATTEDAEAERGTDLADPQPLPDEQIARWEGVGLVRLNLKNLDARSQELIRLKFNEELSYKQISERTGLSVGTAAASTARSCSAIRTPSINSALVSCRSRL